MKKLLATAIAASLVLSSAVFAAEPVTVGQTGVDVVAAATGSAPAPAPTPKPAPKPTTTKPTTTKPTTTAPKPAPAPVTVQAATSITRTLALGAKGSEVKLLQTLLNNNGATLNVDGSFGKGTLAAVKAFQSKNGLKADGIVGPKTLAKLVPAVATAPKPATPAPATPGPAVDTIATASITDSEAAFEKAIGTEGTWIITTLKNLTFDKELVLTGNFKNKKKDSATGLDAMQRKIGLYTQDAKRNVIDRFTLTAPKLTILSPNSRIQGGTFKGDVYVGVSGFKLVDATVDGNIYFTTRDAYVTFSMDAKSKLTGKKELVGVDAVSTASLVNNGVALEKALSKDGNWITALLRDLTVNKELVLDGEFHDKNDPTKDLKRKIALYTQDEKRVTTGRFTLTAPKLTVKSPNANITKGTFKGDVYVYAAGFNLIDAVVDGNIYFATQEAKDTFKMDATSKVTGSQILSYVDGIASASLVRTDVDLQKALSKDGTWIVITYNDITTDKALVIDGEFHDKNLATNALKRKLGLYTHNDPADKKKATHSFTLTAPSITVKSPYATLQYGYFVGDIYVEAPNFNLTNITVTGNVYFAKQEYKDTFTMTNSVVTGVQEIKAK